MKATNLLLSAAIAGAMSAGSATPFYSAPRFAQYYPMSKKPYGIAKSRRAAKKRRNIRKHR